MTRPPRRIERALVAIFDGERDNAFTIQDLCERIWPDVYQDPQAGRIDRKHGARVIRAARNIARQRPKSNGSMARGLAGGSCSSGTTR
jgi:hypothetical protein